MMLYKLLLLLALFSVAACACYIKELSSGVVFADMHDGDQKHVLWSRGHVIVTPFNNDRSWTVVAPVDLQTCEMYVDFNVSGKPNPPPVSLTATFYTLQPAAKYAIEFTDPSRTISATSDFPLNYWIQLESKSNLSESLSLIE